MAKSLDLGDTRLIIETARKEGLLRNQLAYVLATAYHETAGTMKPITERGSEAYLKAKKYFPYIGRGYVQLTWRYNYEDWTKRLGVDFLSHPEWLNKAEYAVVILVRGMKLGTFTGKKLSDYITLDKSEFVNARRIINGTDKAQIIAGHAIDYDALLKAAGYGEEASVVLTQPTQPSQPPVIVDPEPVEEYNAPSAWERFLGWLKQLFN